MKDSTRRFVLLKLTTDRQEASRGLFATAELLVSLYDNPGELAREQSAVLGRGTSGFGPLTLFTV